RWPCCSAPPTSTRHALPPWSWTPTTLTSCGRTGGAPPAGSHRPRAPDIRSDRTPPAGPPRSRRSMNSMNRKILAAGSIAAVAALALTGCSAGSDTPAEPSGPVSLTLSGWSLDTTPEFQALADAFHEKNSDITVTLKEYDPTEYNTLVTADLAAGSGPDIITQKEVKYLTTFQEGGQLLDVSDVKLPDGI